MEELIAHIKRFYSDFHSADLRELTDLYAQDAVFVDPVHTIRGVNKIQHYFAAGRNGLLQCKFVYVGEIVNQDRAVLEWNMDFAHRRLKSGRPICVAGCTVFDFDVSSQRVIKQVDYYDLGGSLYENIPVLGTVVRALKSNLAS